MALRGDSALVQPAFLVKLSMTRIIVANVNKLKRCFRQSALPPMTEQRSTCNRAVDIPVTLEMYGTRDTTADAETPHSDATEVDKTETLTQDPDCKPYHQYHPRASSCGDAETKEERSTSDALGTRVVNPEFTPNEPRVTEGVDDATEIGESAHRYNLRSLPGRNV
jgi:hypothetical protein